MELTELIASVSRVEHKLEEQTQQLKLLTQIVTFLSEKISTTTSQDGLETTSHSGGGDKDGSEHSLQTNNQTTCGFANVA